MADLEIVHLSPLMEITHGGAEVVIGLIDGPVALDHPDLSGANIRAIQGHMGGQCSRAGSAACMHGTFVAGILCAKRGSAAPAICPGCTLLVRPIFAEAPSAGARLPSATPKELAAAIIECIDEGARIINLSVALAQPSSNNQRDLAEALDYAAKRHVLIVAAAGNQGAMASSILTRHPWIIPVIACDQQGRPMGQSNLGGSIGRRGLSAPGDAITSLGTDGQPLTSGGTSAAAPFVTGAIALLWSEFPEATATAIKSAVTQAFAPRRVTVVPPLLDAWAAYQFLLETYSRRRKKIMDPNQTSGQSARHPVVSATGPTNIGPALANRAETLIQPQACGCGGAANAEAADGGGVEAAFVFAIGRVEMRFPSLSVEKEFAQATGRAETAGLTDRQATQAVLSERSNRYIVRQLCWVLTIEGLETYILIPRDPSDYDLLLEAVRSNPGPLDVDVVIGVRGPVAPPELCNGLQVPLVIVDQLYSFDRDMLIRALPRPESVTAKQDKQFRSAASELFDRILQLADNAGAADEHRAVNFLAVRYPAIYSTVTELNDRNFTLTGVEVQPSRLSGIRKIVAVIFSFSNRQTDVTEKYFVRVDVTEEFPFLVSRMAPYYDR